MKKRIVVLMACLMVLILVLVACGNDDSTTNTDNETGITDTGGEADGSDERQFDLEIPGFPLDTPITVSMLGRHVGIVDWNEMPFWQALTEATHISWEFTTPPNDDFTTSLNLAFAAGDLPDILFGSGLTAAQQIEHGSVGTLIPLQDLIADYAPNIRRLLDENPMIRMSITAPDGNIYALPTIDQSFSSIWPVGPVYYNGMWMEALDAEIPTTLDEFTDLMFRFRDEMPEILGVDQVFPISATDEMQWLRVWILSIWGMASRGIEATDGVVVHNVTTEAYRAFLEWMHMAFEEGLIHPEIFTLSGDQHDALGQQNLVGFFQSWHSHGFLGTDEVQAMDNPMLRPLTSEWSPNGVLPRSPGFSIGQFAITSNAQDPAAIIRFIDWLYTEEGAAFANNGPEGYFWVYDKHETGEQVRVFAPDVDPDDGYARGRVTPYFGFPAPQLIPPRVPRVLRDTTQPLEYPLDEFLRAETAATIEVYGKVNIPPTMLTAEEVDFISVANADLNIEIDRQEASFITGITPINDETWADFQATLVTIGIEDIVATWQDAHNRWLAAAE